METIRTPEKETAFLSALAATCNVTKACEAAGIARSSAYLWYDEDEVFAARWEKALQIGADALEDEAVRRAHDGVLKPVFHQGVEVGQIREYSDTLLIFLLNGAKPDKYKKNSKVELEGSLNLKQMPDEELNAKLSALLG